MKTFIETDIQDNISEIFGKYEIYPYSIIFTYCMNSNKGGLLSITFFLPGDVDFFLDKVNYKSLCDQSGYTIIKDTNTVIITGMALLNLINNL